MATELLTQFAGTAIVTATAVLVGLMLIFAYQLFGGLVRHWWQRRHEWVSRKAQRDFEARVAKERADRERMLRALD